MRDLCVIGLILICAPWVTGIGICLWRYFESIWDKMARYIELTKLIHNIKRMLSNSDENKVTRLAFLIEAKYQRSQLFSLDDLKIWKAFI